MAHVTVNPADVSALRLLVEVMDSGSLSAAARAARITQPSASQALRRLERRLGLTLLVRTPRGSRVTGNGQRIGELAREALGALDDVVAQAATLAARDRGELRVSASYTIAEYLLPTRLPPTTEMTVAVSVVNSTDAVTQVRHGEADLCFIEGPVDLAGLTVRRIARDELVVVTAPGRPWSDLAAPLPPAVLAAAPLLLREPGSGTRASYEQALRALDLDPAPPLGVLSSTEALKAAVRAGVGETVVSRLAVATELATGALVRVPVAGLRLTRDLRAGWLPRQLTPPATRLLQAMMEDG
jgi:DNA-binding transcriptional LysR family regulator